MKKTFSIIAIALSFALSISCAIALGIHLPDYLKYCNPDFQGLNLAYNDKSIEWINRGNNNYSIKVDWTNLSGKEYEVDIVIVIQQAVLDDHYAVDGYKYGAVRWQGTIHEYVGSETIIDVDSLIYVDPSQGCSFYIYFTNEDILFAEDIVFLPSGEEIAFLDENADSVKTTNQLASNLSSNWNKAFSNIVMVLSIVIGTGVIIGSSGIVAMAVKNKKKNENIHQEEEGQQKPISPNFARRAPHITSLPKDENN
ncbi:MAG: hypothetical protein IJX25_00555 [Clostridia bacterium]|nr:hypothetical protein [Clostridia bacterium]MBQ8792990.1 hypothetical protein [Clostridia bacterium]